MTDKEVIIDGVNVAGCCYIEEGNECEAYQTECEAQYCYYKQLQRKEQECERLKKIKDDYFFQLEAAHQGILDKNKIIEEIEKVIALYQEPIELDTLSLPAAIESILERLKTDNEELENGIQDFISDNSSMYSYDERRPDTLEELQVCMEAVHDKYVNYKQALEKINESITSFHYATLPFHRGATHDLADMVDEQLDKVKTKINEVLKDE